MSPSFADFVERAEASLAFEDVPPEVREELDDVLVGIAPGLYGDSGDGGGGGGNISPKVTDITVTDQQGAVYTFEAEASDPQDSASALTYEWQIDGVQVGGGSQTLTRAFQSEGDVEVTATATDTGGKSSLPFSKTVSITLPEPAERFSVDEFEFVGPIGQTQSIAYSVSDADGDDDVLALRLSVEPDSESSISPTTTTLTDQDKGPVASLSDEFPYLNGFGGYTARLEALDLDGYDGTVSTPFTGEDIDDGDEFVTLREQTDSITD